MTSYVKILLLQKYRIYKEIYFYSVVKKIRKMSAAVVNLRNQ